MSLTQSKEVNSLSKRYSTHIERRITRTVMVGDIAIGSDYPVRVQSMINEDTMDVEMLTWLSKDFMMWVVK